MRRLLVFLALAESAVNIGLRIAAPVLFVLSWRLSQMGMWTEATYWLVAAFIFDRWAREHRFAERSK